MGLQPTRSSTLTPAANWETPPTCAANQSGSERGPAPVTCVRWRAEMRSWFSTAASEVPTAFGGVGTAPPTLRRRDSVTLGIIAVLGRKNAICLPRAVRHRPAFVSAIDRLLAGTPPLTDAQQTDSAPPAFTPPRSAAQLPARRCRVYPEPRPPEPLHRFTSGGGARRDSLIRVSFLRLLSQLCC